MVNQHVKIYLVLITICFNVGINANIQVIQKSVSLKLVVTNSRHHIILIHMEINFRMPYFVIR